MVRPGFDAVRRWAVVGAMLLAVAACARTTQWQNPQLPPSQWARDEADCRRWANGEVEKEAARDQAIYGDSTIGRSSSHAAQMTRYAAARTRLTLTARCMKARGYVEAKPGES